MADDKPGLAEVLIVAIISLTCNPIGLFALVIIMFAVTDGCKEDNHRVRELEKRVKQLEANKNEEK
jgi:hypothetical protein